MVSGYTTSIYVLFTTWPFFLTQDNQLLDALDRFLVYPTSNALYLLNGAGTTCFDALRRNSFAAGAEHQKPSVQHGNSSFELEACATLPARYVAKDEASAQLRCISDFELRRKPNFHQKRFPHWHFKNFRGGGGGGVAAMPGNEWKEGRTFYFPFSDATGAWLHLGLP